MSRLLRLLSGRQPFLMMLQPSSRLKGQVGETPQQPGVTEGVPKPTNALTLLE